MSCQKRCAVAFLAAFLAWSEHSRGAIITRFDPPDTTVGIGETFDLNIVADIPQPVVGWGLDLTVVNPVISIVGQPVIGPLWSSAFAPDGDGLAALAFPDSISGNDILLATVTFSADALGATDLVLSTTLGDLSEGFPLDPTGFAEVTFEAGQVIVIPEPVTLALFVISGLVVMVRRR